MAELTWHRKRKGIAALPWREPGGLLAPGVAGGKLGAPSRAFPLGKLGALAASWVGITWLRVLPKKLTSSQIQRIKTKQSHSSVSLSDLAVKTQFEGGIREVRYRLSGATDPIYKLACPAGSQEAEISINSPWQVDTGTQIWSVPRAALVSSRSEDPEEI